MEENYNTMDGSEKKRKNKIPLIVIGILLVVLLIVGGLYYKNYHKTKNVYYSMIDKFATQLNNVWEKSSEYLDNPYNILANLTFSGESSNPELKSVFDILNKINIKIDGNIDYDNKLEVANIKALYAQDNLLDVDFYVDDNDSYVFLNNLYDKAVKLESTEYYQQFWQKDSYENMESISKEILKTLKNSLKDEYFQVVSDQYNFNGKDITVENHILSLDQKAIIEYKNNFIDNLIKNETLLESIVDLSLEEITKEDIINELNELKELEDIDIDQFKMKVYLDRKNEIYKVNITIDEESIILNRTSKEEYEILLEDINGSSTIGAIHEQDEKLKITLQEEDVKIELDLTKENAQEQIIDLKIFSEDDEIDFYLKSKENNQTIKVLLNVPSEEIKLLINLDMNYKNIKNVSKKDVSNYINMDDLTEDDFNIISEKLMNSEGIKAILNTLGLKDMLSM